MKNLGLTLFGIGFISTLVGGAGLGGPTTVENVILIVVALPVTAIGYKLWAESE